MKSKDETEEKDKKTKEKIKDTIGKRTKACMRKA